MGEHDLPKVEGYRQDTPQNAALALYRYLIPTNERLQLQTVQRAYTGLVEILEGLVTEDVIKQSKEPDEDLVDFLYKMHDLEVESVTEGADGARHVKFKPVSEWASAFEVRVRKVGDVWKIYEAGRHRPKWSDSGDTTYEYEKLDNIYYSLLDS
jgi:hypothetical protein